MTPPASPPIGVVIAAGRGRRMGRTKQLVPWPTSDGTKPLVAAAFDAVQGVCGEMIVVLGHEADAVAAAIAPRSFQRVLSDPDAPMFQSIRAGLEAAADIDPDSTVVLQPGDHPQVTAATLQLLVETAARYPDRAILPEWAGHGGHPVFIPPAVVRQVLEADCPGGLRQFWIDHPELCVRLPVDDATVVRDIDTPDQMPGSSG